MQLAERPASAGIGGLRLFYLGAFLFLRCSIEMGNLNLLETIEKNLFGLFLSKEIKDAISSVYTVIALFNARHLLEPHVLFRYPTLNDPKP